MRVKKKCLECGKKYNSNNKFFCSKDCYLLSDIRKEATKKAHKIQKRKGIGFWGISKEQHQKMQRKANKNSKKKKIGIYGISKRRRREIAIMGGRKSAKNKVGIHGLSKEDRTENSGKGAKKAHKIQKRKGIGFWGISKEQRGENTKKEHEINKKNKWGPWSSKNQEKAHKVLYEKKLGSFYNPELNRLQRLNQSRNRKSYKFNNIYFDSNVEREFAMNIHYQQEKLVEGINCQVNVGRKFFDFLSRKYKCFIEFHPWDRKLTLQQYKKERRKALNENNYKNYKLIVIR